MVVVGQVALVLENALPLPDATFTTTLDAGMKEETTTVVCQG